MTKRIEFEIEVPDNVTDAQVREWIEWQLGYMGGCSNDNPLVDTDIEALSVSVD